MKQTLNITKEMLEADFAAGLWHKDIAKKYNCSWRYIYELVKKYEIVLERKNKTTDPYKLKIESACKYCGKTYYVTKHPGYCSYNCWTKETMPEMYKKDYADTNSEIGKKIQELREQNYSYKQIAKQLNCAPATVSYHCNQNTREDVVKRNKEWRKDEYNQFKERVEKFFSRKRRTKKIVHKCEDWNKKIRDASSHFQRTNHKRNLKYNTPTMEKYTYKDVIKHIGGTTTKCYLTGRKIDILKDDYTLDHIVPISKGGTNELSNLGITCPDANYAKGDMLMEDFIVLCKEVLENQGYTVIKK